METEKDQDFDLDDWCKMLIKARTQSERAFETNGGIH